MAENTKLEVMTNFRDDVELVRSVSDKKFNLLRPASRYYSVLKDVLARGKGRYSILKDTEDFEVGNYDKPLPCFGCGIGWFSFLLGIVFPLLWYYAAFLYLGNYYRKDPRERAGLAASAIAAMGFSVLLLIIVGIRLLV